MTDEQKAAAYYKAGMLKQAPPWVPATVRVRGLLEEANASVSGAEPQAERPTRRES